MRLGAKWHTSEPSARPKVADIVTLSATVCLMGAPAAFPQINHALGEVLFWSGLAGMVIYPGWRWGLEFLQQRQSLRLRRRVSFQEAARVVYEAMERSQLDDMTAGGYSSSMTPLTHFKYVILSAARREEITLYGTRAPSQQSLPISADLISQLEPSRNDANSIGSISRGSPIDFHDVWLSRRDVRRVIKGRTGLLERVNKGLAL
jgi:hypothetical protein